MSIFQDFEEMCLTTQNKSKIHCKAVQDAFAAWWAMYVSSTSPCPSDIKIAKKNRRYLKPDRMGYYTGICFTPMVKGLIIGVSKKFSAPNTTQKNRKNCEDV